jgi:hypothetical protein
MHIRNLEPAARQGGHLNRLVTYFNEINTREVFMSDIVKVCKVHGELTEKQVYRFKNNPDIQCKPCKFISYKKYEERKKNGKLEEKKKLLELGYKKVCNIHGPLDDNFIIDFRKDGSIICLFCRREKNAAYAKKHSSEIKKRKALNYRKNIIENRENVILKTYNITIEKYKEIIAKNNGKCWICNKEETVKNKTTNDVRPLCIDHNHENGNIRGALCSRCNKALSLYSDSPELLEAAAKYLRSSWNE